MSSLSSLSGATGSAFVSGGPSYYKQQLDTNMGQYNDIKSGYAGISGNIGSIYDQAKSGLDTSLQSVLGGIGVTKENPWGYAKPAAEAIDRSFTAARGKTDSALTSGGLGNTTVRGSLQNQNALQAGQAYGGLGSQLAQTATGYMAQYGLAGSQLMAQKAGALGGLGSSYLGNLAGFHMNPQYPPVGQNIVGGHGGGSGGGGGSQMPGPFGGHGFGGGGSIGQPNAMGYSQGFGNYNYPTVQGLNQQSDPYGATLPDSGIQPSTTDPGMSQDDINLIYGNQSPSDYNQYTDSL